MVGRRYTPKLKGPVVLEVLSGEKTPGQVAKAYRVHPNVGGAVEAVSHRIRSAPGAGRLLDDEIDLWLDTPAVVDRRETAGTLREFYEQPRYFALDRGLGRGEGCARHSVRGALRHRAVAHQAVCSAIR